MLEFTEEKELCSPALQRVAQKGQRKHICGWKAHALAFTARKL